MAQQVVLVTGAARGYGEVVSRRLAADGALVAVLARDSGRAAALADDIGGIPLVADVLDRDAVTDAVDTLMSRVDRIDALVNNAGLGGTLGPAWEVDPDDWWHCFEVNVRGTHTVTSAVLPSMIAAGAGRIVNVVSNAGVNRWPLGSAYAVSKAAVIKYGENLAAELRRYGIVTVNFHPGILEIGLTESLFSSQPEPSTYGGRVADWFRQEIELGHSVDSERSASMLTRLALTAPLTLTGRYVTAYDDLDDLLARAESARPEAFTLGLLQP
ncbi:MAG TPA: SDR family oxidoreductase [Jatrophihabitantaceae bacterium]|nr:SDR family oxidoreductase [Jatrophihabitantaceae bacterium]